MEKRTKDVWIQVDEIVSEASESIDELLHSVDLKDTGRSLDAIVTLRELVLQAESLILSLHRSKPADVVSLTDRLETHPDYSPPTAS